MLPPIQRVDHTPVLVLPNDSAWDHERIEREQDAIEKSRKDPAKRAACQWPSLEDHPIYRYNSGDSRFDLSTVQSYLKPEEDQVRFTLRRLPRRPHWRQVEHLNSQGRGVDARDYAVQHGLVEVYGLDFPLTPNEPLDEADMDRLRSLVGDDGLAIIGYAVINVSRELTAPEKKVSGC